MAKKIEGMAHQYAEENILADGNTSLVATDSYSARPGTMYTMSGTLVIHDGPHEPVYTASEVTAKLNAVDAMEHFTGAQIQMLAEYGFDVMGLAVPKADHA